MLLLPTRFAHARYISRMIDRFLNWGYVRQEQGQLPAPPPPRLKL